MNITASVFYLLPGQAYTGHAPHPSWLEVGVFVAPVCEPVYVDCKVVWLVTDCRDSTSYRIILDLI